jgi:tetratricopeptide (TPR) repeat protein
MAGMERLFRFAFPIPLLAAALALLPSVAMAQGRDMGPSECFSCRAAPSAPAYSPPAVYQPSPAELQQQQAEQLRQQHLNEAHTANQQCIELFNKRDWAKAVALFQTAAVKNPGDPIIRKNLARAQEALAGEQAQLRIQQQDKAAANHMQKTIDNFAQTLSAAPASGGLDFDGRTSGNAPGAGGNGGGLDFTAVVSTAGPKTPAAALPSGDPRVVDARNVPSGLSKPVENAIAGAYANSPPGVSDRVRKGFQAVADRDWKVAKAWFEEALNRDPGNAGLKRLVELANAAPARTDKVATAGQQLQLPGPEDWKLIFPGLQALEDKQAMDALFGLQPSR